MSTNNKISNLIKSQVPFYVRNDHEKFIAFIEAYYEYLEQANTTLSGGKTVERAKNLLNYIDVDKTLDDFAEKLYSYYLHNFPKESKADKNVILKNVKDFYRAKGTQKSIDFLMRVLFNEEPTYYYPKNDILRASDGKWFIQRSLRVTDTRIDNISNTFIAAIQKFVGTRITGLSSNAEATIETTDSYFEFGIRVDELSISSPKGTFDDGEIIRTRYIDENGVERTITSNVFGGIVNTITVNNGGSQYKVGDPVAIISSTGTGAVLRVAQVSSGEVDSITVLDGGVGFRANDYVLVTGGGGSGANAQVSNVVADGTYHPTSYNLVSTLISSISAQPINTANYALFPGFISGGLGTTGGSNANTTLANSLISFVYGNTGPAQAFVINSKGSGYSGLPSISIVANTIISQLGILGRMNVVSSGTGYQNTDYIEFVNVRGGYGSGANANVIVNATGSIITAKFTNVQGQIVGGSGYSQDFLPRANIVTSTGSGGNVAVVSVLGDSESLIASNTTIGTIQRIIIENKGSGYKSTDTADLTGYGDGTAQTTLSVVEGVFSYPGRWLNDDGHISSYNFLQDRDYYQNYSYVVRVKESIDNYRKALKELIHPSGMKLFGEYVLNEEVDALTSTASDDVNSSVQISYSNSAYSYSNIANIVSGANSVFTISANTAGLTRNSEVYIEFTGGNVANYSANDFYYVSNVINSNAFTIYNGKKLPQTMNVRYLGELVRSVYFRSDGKKMYLGRVNENIACEFDLIYPWDISSAILKSNTRSTSNADFASLFFSSNGRFMYSSQASTDTIVQFRLSDAWNVNSVNVLSSTLSTLNISSHQQGPTDLFIDDDGRNLFVIGSTPSGIVRYNLGTPWSISTANYVSNISYTSIDTTPNGIGFKDDGTIMFVIGQQYDIINQFSLSEAWNIQTSTFTSNVSISAFDITPASLYFSENGKIVYFTGTTKDLVTQLPLRQSWNIASIVVDDFRVSNSGNSIITKYVT
jgi:hypothetical protein